MFCTLIGLLNQRNVGLPKQCYTLAYYLKPVATNYDKTQQQQHLFPQIFIPQNTPYSASFFRNENSANYTFRKFRIPQSTPSRGSYTIAPDSDRLLQ